MSSDDVSPEQWRQDLADYSILTGREADVLVRLRAGATIEEVADDLGMSESTIEVHYAEVCRKARGHRPTYLLLFGPMAALKNLDDYPELKEQIHTAYEIPDDVDSAELLRARF